MNERIIVVHSLWCLYYILYILVVIATGSMTTKEVFLANELLTNELKLNELQYSRANTPPHLSINQ